MDGGTFDQWTRRVARAPGSRRGVLRLSLGGGLGLLGFGQVAEEASACVKTGKECRRGKPQGNCCSGTCRRGKCRQTPGAAGCQVNSGDRCRGQSVPCPNNPLGTCVILDSGKPFCAELTSCQLCTTNADCQSLPGGRCVTTCPICSDTSNQGCFYTP